MTGIINYGAGNLYSLECALARLNAPCMRIHTVEDIDRADRLIIPGVGHAGPAMERLLLTGLVPQILATGKPVLGICLGMQLMTLRSEEAEASLMGIFPSETLRFQSLTEKIPHTGWNRVRVKEAHPLLKGLDGQHFYFVHSYYVPDNPYCIGNTIYTKEFASVIARNNFLGVQFHPEKSGTAGEALLRNFIQLAA
jgi:imidazole glycerol-phosphate synthase subunit HisH